MNRTLTDDRDHLPEILETALQQATDYLEGLDRRPAAVDPGTPASERLPAAGVGAREALRLFQERYGNLLSGSPGPRYFGFVTGGSTPAALAGDWLASAFDQNAQLGGDTVAPFVELETLGFLRELFGLPEDFTGSFVSGATVSNFVGLATARQKLARDVGIDVAEEGTAGLAPIPVLSGSAHSSILKAMSMLGMGRRTLVRVPCLDGREAVDVAALEGLLREEAGRPVIVVANAGTVNTTDFDDLEAIGRLKERYPFWLHVDGAFGFRALAAWMSLMAYGREGYREIVERDCDVARQLGKAIEAHTSFRLLAPVRLNVVCFTLRREGGEVDAETVRRFLQFLRDDGRAFLTGTTLHGQPAVRIAVSNWRTEEKDVEITLAAMTDAARAVL